MKKFNFLALVFLGLFVQVNSASACDCMTGPRGEGFYAELGTQNLPQNAKGVLFFVKPEGSVLPVVYRNLQPSQFSFRDSQNPRELPIKIKKLEMQKVRGEFQNYNMYRLEPIDGFKAGHEYIFKLKEAPAWDPSPYRHTLNVTIDNVVIGRSDLVKTVFAANGEAVVEKLQTSVDRGGACSAELESKVQKVNFQLPARLEPYKNSLRYFVHYQKGAQKEVWSYKKTLCSSLSFGRSGVELGQDTLFIPTTYLGTRLTRGPKYQITGSWVFPEVDATVYESPPFSFSYAP